MYVATPTVTYTIHSHPIGWIRMANLEHLLGGRRVGALKDHAVLLKTITAARHPDA